MISVVKRTGHSSYYVEKGMAAMGKTPSQMGIQGDYRICGGGRLSIVTREQFSDVVSSVSYLVRSAYAWLVSAHRIDDFCY